MCILKKSAAQVIAVARTADLILMMLDSAKAEMQRYKGEIFYSPLICAASFSYSSLLLYSCAHKLSLAYLPTLLIVSTICPRLHTFGALFLLRPLLEKELESCGIRLNKEPPKISFRVKGASGFFLIIS